MSDLQCPARFLLVAVGDDRAGRAVPDLAARLRRERVAAVWSGPAAAGVAGLAAGALGVAAHLLSGAAAEDDVAAFRAALAGVADLHRGECVLVLDRAAVITAAVPLAATAGDLAGPAARTPAGALAGRRLLPPWQPVGLEVDGDGWRLLSWPGAAEPVG